MKLLVLGGTVYLSREIAAVARDRGHDVTAAARGASGAPPDGVRFVRLDRDTDHALKALGDDSFDAVVDVARRPGPVRHALEALAGRSGHWTFVSTISVYADLDTPGHSVATARLQDADYRDDDDPGLYGAQKVACERNVLELAADALIARPGLIIGPGDPLDRFGYWPQRIAAGGEVLVPGEPDDPVQYVDVRDLAQWLVGAAEAGTTGTYDAVCPPYPRQRFLEEIAGALDADVRFTWVPSQFLSEQGVNPWAGPESLGMWAPLPDYAGILARDPVGTAEAGLVTRPIGETATDWRRWRSALDDPPPLGADLSRDKEAAVLAAWHARDQRAV